MRGVGGEKGGQEVDRAFKRFLTGLGVAFIAVSGYCIGLAINHPTNRIPDTDKVKAGYVVPSKLEMTLEDVDLDGKKEELILRYNNKPYLFKLKENGQPEIVPFEISEKRY